MASAPALPAPAAAQHAPPPDPPRALAPEGVGAAGGAVAQGEGLQEWTLHKSADGSLPEPGEQRMLWLMNNARSDPTAEGVFLATSEDPDVADGRDVFGVDTEILQEDFAALPAAPPAAFDIRIHDASELHSLDMIDRDSQDHDGQIDRVTTEGFEFTGIAVSVFAFSRSPLHAHAALNIDWGEPDEDRDGVQDAKGHRNAIMDNVTVADEMLSLTNVGIAILPDSDPGTSVGPEVVSIAYAEGGTGEHNRFVVGTVWEDANGNDRYDEAEGLGDVMVMPDIGDFFAVTGDAGGYAFPATEAGTYTVGFSGGELDEPVMRTAEVGAESVLLDVVQVPEPASLLSGAVALGALGALARRRERGCGRAAREGWGSRR